MPRGIGSALGFRQTKWAAEFLLSASAKGVGLSTGLERIPQPVALSILQGFAAKRAPPSATSKA